MVFGEKKFAPRERALLHSRGRRAPPPRAAHPRCAPSRMARNAFFSRVPLWFSGSAAVGGCVRRSDFSRGGRFVDFAGCSECFPVRGGARDDYHARECQR
jgi:hypothetical protein